MKQKHLLVTIIALLATVSAFAQGYSVKIRLVEEKTAQPVPFATVSLTPSNSSKAVKYVLTDDAGKAILTKVSKGSYVLKAEIMGYKTHSQNITVDKSLDLGDVKIPEDIEVLEAAKVTDIGNPIVVKKDTIEYNASSFKTSDNDMLEQLLKKLPGVEVGADGSITANGETIKKITIDGKTFFLDDPQLASKNIPAKIIEKELMMETRKLLLILNFVLVWPRDGLETSWAVADMMCRAQGQVWMTGVIRVLRWSADLRTIARSASFSMETIPTTEALTISPEV